MIPHMLRLLPPGQGEECKVQKGRWEAELLTCGRRNRDRFCCHLTPTWFASRTGGKPHSRTASAAGVAWHWRFDDRETATLVERTQTFLAREHDVRHAAQERLIGRLGYKSRGDSLPASFRTHDHVVDLPVD